MTASQGQDQVAPKKKVPPVWQKETLDAWNTKDSFFALAQMELTLITARLAQRLDLTPTAQRPPGSVGLVVSQPAGGALMHVRPRASAGAA